MTYPTFQNSAKIRLETYRAKATEHNAKHGASQSWKDRRYPEPQVLKQSPLNRSQDGKELYIDRLLDAPFSYTDAHDIARLDHTGWYADNFQDNLIRGAVVEYRNPRKTNPDYDGDSPSHVFYLPATYATQWDTARVVLRTFTDRQDCARYADRLAEREAEESREYDAKFQAEQQIEDAKATIHALNRETLAVIRELKTGKPLAQYPALCAAIRERIEDAIDQRGELFKRIADLTDNCWLAVE